MVQVRFQKMHCNYRTDCNTEDIKQALDKDKFACGVFLDLQKVFDTMKHNILMAKHSLWIKRHNSLLI